MLKQFKKNQISSAEMKSIMGGKINQDDCNNCIASAPANCDMFTPGAGNYAWELCISNYISVVCNGCYTGEV